MRRPLQQMAGWPSEISEISFVDSSNREGHFFLFVAATLQANGAVA